MAKGVSWSAVASTLALFLAGLFPLFNADAYGHLAQGRQIAVLGRVPKVDSFSFWKPEPQPWSNYEWAYDWLTWLAYDGLGPNALVLGKSVALGVLGYLLVVLASRLGKGAALSGPLTLVALLLAIPVARFRFTARPQIVGLLFPAVLLVGISSLYSDQISVRKKAWIVGALAVLHVVWVNMHGSHLFGLLVSLLFLAFSFRTVAFRWMVALVALQLLATGCTPFGYAIVTDAIAHVLRPEYRELVVEWSPWSPGDPLRFLLAPIVVALFVIGSMGPVVRGSRFGLAYGVCCVLLCLMASRSIRFVAHQLLFCAPFIAVGLSQMRWVQPVRRVSVLVVAAAAVVCGLWTSRLIPRLGFGLGEDRRDYPWASTTFIEHHVKAPRIVGTLKDSWMLMFAAPSAKLLVDGRVPYYGPEMIRSVIDAFANPVSFQWLLSEYDVNTVVIDHTRSDHIPATDYLDASPEWGLLFVEDKHSLFVRRDAIRGLQPFRAVPPGYRVGGLLDLRFDDAEVRAEATRLSARPNTTYMQAWHQGIELLRPLARDGDRAGIRKHASTVEQRLARASYGRLSIAAQRFPGFTTIEIFRAMAALSACDVELAREALRRAEYPAQTRWTSLVGIEIGLRGGDDAERRVATAHLEQLLSRPETRGDPWVHALAADVATRCP